MKDLRIEEVAMIVGVSVQTIERWYRYKRDHPDSEIAEEIPDYKCISTVGSRKLRRWSQEAVWSLVQFKASRKLGRTGKMGKYGGKGTHGKKNTGRKVKP